jgi:hypothetical protein
MHDLLKRPSTIIPALTSGFFGPSHWSLPDHDEQPLARPRSFGVNRTHWAQNLRIPKKDGLQTPKTTARLGPPISGAIDLASKPRATIGLSGFETFARLSKKRADFYLKSGNIFESFLRPFGH